MADTPRSALADHLVAGRFGRRDDEAGVRLREVPVRVMVQTAGVPAGEAARGALAGFGMAGEPAPLRCWRGDEVDLLWTGPGQYLAVSREGEGAELCGALGAALAGVGAVAVDLGHARTVMEVAGAASREVLAKGCPLDVDAMRAGDCATTVLSHFNVLLHCVEPDRFEVFVTRSFAVACFEWLRRAGEEFGVQVD